MVYLYGSQLLDCSTNDYIITKNTSLKTKLPNKKPKHNGPDNKVSKNFEI